MVRPCGHIIKSFICAYCVSDGLTENKSLIRMLSAATKLNKLIASHTCGNRLICVDKQIDDFIREVVQLAHAECVVVGGAHVGQVLGPHGIFGVLDLQDSRLRMVQMLLLALLLLLHAVRAATGEVGIELRMLIVWCASMVLLLIAGDLVLPVVVHRLHLLLQPLVLLVKQMLLVLCRRCSYIYYHDRRDGN